MENYVREVFVQSSDTAADVWKAIAANVKTLAVSKLNPPEELNIDIDNPEITAEEVKAVGEANLNAPLFRNAVNLIGAGITEVKKTVKARAEAAFKDIVAMLNVPEITTQIIISFQHNFVHLITEEFKGFKDKLSKNGAQQNELPIGYSALNCVTVKRVANINKFCYTALTVGPLVPTLLAKTTTPAQ